VFEILADIAGDRGVIQFQRMCCLLGNLLDGEQAARLKAGQSLRHDVGNAFLDARCGSGISRIANMPIDLN
jgi:hypothetical protein